MFDHSTTWSRASAWFQSAPHSGLEFDNFLGSGPFVPMEGSHLCHKGLCVNPHHSVYEDVRTNASRKQCHTTAQDMRRMGIPVPKFCANHPQDPCLLQVSRGILRGKVLTKSQHACLTVYESFLIQFSVMRRAKNMPDIAHPSRPGNHPFSTFETSLPLSFVDCAITADPANLTNCEIAISPKSTVLFHCKYCLVASSFKSVSGFWAHIRDGHPLVPIALRLEDVKHAGSIWRAAKEQDHSRGTLSNSDDTVWSQVGQMLETTFDWEVFCSWKLAYNRKRKFGREANGMYVDEQGLE